MHAGGENVLRAMSESVCRFAVDNTHIEKIGEVAVKGDFTEAYDDANARQGTDLLGKMRCAVANLLGQWFISRWCTANDRGDPRMTKLEAIVAGDAIRLAGQPQFVENGIHKSSGAVAGKRPTCPIGTMGSGGESKDQDTSARIAETRNGARPISLVLISAAAGFADAAAVVTKARTTVAFDDGLVELLQNRRKGLNFRTNHCIP